MVSRHGKERALLEEFYSLTYPAHLGIPFPGFATTSRYASIYAFLDDCCSIEGKASVVDRLAKYELDLTPQLRLGIVEEVLLAQAARGLRAVLDFGCGNGRVLQQLTLRYSQLDYVYGIETDQQELELAAELDFPDGVTVCFGRELPTTREGIRFDLIMANYTLHHIAHDRQQGVINALVTLLSDSGVLVVLEDSWDAGICPQSLHDDALDGRFGALPSELKRELYLLNDRHSNGWIHMRSLSCDKAWYRTVDDWGRQLGTASAVAATQRVSGFERGRLHGVPSACIVARKSR